MSARALRLLCIIAVLAAVPALAANEVLFPAPLHITRETTDPISGTKSVVDEYCHGNHVVAVSGSRTSIAEYDKRVLTVIDFDAGTYGVTAFEALARAWEPRAGTAPPSPPRTRGRGA